MRRAWTLAAIGMMVSVLCLAARAEDAGTVLRYKWVEGQQDSVAVSVDTAGTIVATTAAGTQTTSPKVHAELTMFSRVDKVTPEGLAQMKISFGLISFDTTTPDGKVVHGEMNLADSTMLITVDGQKTTQPLPPGTVDLLAKGFTPILDDRGQVKGMVGGGSLQDAFAKLPGTGGAPNLGQMMSGLDPILPEKAVKVGDVWEITLPLGQLLGQPTAKPIALRFKYEDDEKLDDVLCRHFSAVANVSDLTISIPPGLGGGMRTDMTGFNVQATTDYYLSMDDTHVVLAKSKAIEGGTLHIQGTQKGADGADVPVDMTMTLEDFKVTTEMKRQ